MLDSLRHDWMLFHRVTELFIEAIAAIERSVTDFAASCNGFLNRGRTFRAVHENVERRRLPRPFTLSRFQVCSRFDQGHLIYPAARVCAFSSEHTKLRNRPQAYAMNRAAVENIY